MDRMHDNDEEAVTVTPSDDESDNDSQDDSDLQSEDESVDDESVDDDNDTDSQEETEEEEGEIEEKDGLSENAESPLGEIEKVIADAIQKKAEIDSHAWHKCQTIVKDLLDLEITVHSQGGGKGGSTSPAENLPSSCQFPWPDPVGMHEIT